MNEVELAAAALSIYPMVQLYDGNGRHYRGVYPPLVEDNVLTPVTLPPTCPRL